MGTLIAQLCGAICPEVWPGVEQLDLYSKMEVPKIQKRRVKERLKPDVKDQWAVDLLDRLLTLNPSARIDSDTALNHDFFWSDPMPQSLEKMLSQHTQSMFEFLAPIRRWSPPWTRRWSAKTGWWRRSSPSSWQQAKRWPPSPPGRLCG